MMLAEKHCAPCASKAKVISGRDAMKLLADMSGWRVSEDGRHLTREWSFKNFARALDFVNQVSVIAEAENHHPDISFGWGYAKITLMTHDVGGLTENDFVLAAKFNALGHR